MDANRARGATARRGIAVALLFGMTLILPPSADAADQTLRFTYGVDFSSWYWTKQKDVVVEAPDVPGAPGAAQRVRVSNPQSANTLPVAVGTDDAGNAGVFEKISAIAFSLPSRGVTPGSTITKFSLRIVEAQDQSEFPGFGASGKQILACRIDDFWPSGSAEEWGTQPRYAGQGTVPAHPPYAAGTCVAGVRDDQSSPPAWVFNLTTLARPWGADPYSAFGVMLVPVASGDPTEAWQVNLKIPGRDANGNLVESTKDYATVTLAVTAPVPASPGGGAAPPPAPEPFVPAPAPGPGPDTGILLPPPLPTSVAPGPTLATDRINLAAPATEAPPLPGIVWALVPLGLIALAMVRSAVLEPVAPARERSVIGAIRSRNRERRGGGIAQDADPMVRVGATLTAGAAAVKAKIRKTIPGGSKR